VRRDCRRDDRRRCPRAGECTRRADRRRGAAGTGRRLQRGLRLDDWELASHVQDELRRRWQASTGELAGGLADLDWFRRQIWQLYGFDVPSVDYNQPVEVDVPWPVTSEHSS
jgi:enoyl-[acyl-carrier protein] reductase / trans-2-enoyl-CoA reductase (NAD+)